MRLLYDRDQGNVKELITSFGLAPKALVGWILYSLMVWVGWLFFVLPGFIALLRFAFFPYFIIDKNVGPIAALKMSYEVTKHHVWDMFAFWVAINVLFISAFSPGLALCFHGHFQHSHTHIFIVNWL